MKFVVLSILVFVTLFSQGRSQAGRSCSCTNEYIPFCGSDGVTYPNRCSLECAKSTVRSLRVNFEGVCAEPYRSTNSGTRGSGGSNFPTTRRPGSGGSNYPTTQRPQILPPQPYRPTTQSPYRPPPTPQPPYRPPPTPQPPYRPPPTPQPPYRPPPTPQRPYRPPTTQSPYRPPTPQPPYRETTPRPYWAPAILF